MAMIAVHKGDMQQLAGATGTGLATALLGTVIPILGLAGGLGLQYFARGNTHVSRAEHVIDGTVDGSAALLTRALLLPSGVRPQAVSPCAAQSTGRA